jgi:CBS domain-containing protein
VATIADVMSRDLVTVPPTATVAEAATVMSERHVGSALVLDGGALVGIFTERDILRALGSDFDAAKHQVSEWMARSPRTIAPGADVREALDLMLEEGFRHLPVVDEEAVVGVVSIRDLTARPD